MNDFPKDVKIELTLGETGIEKMQVRSARETQALAVRFSTTILDLVDDFETRYLERLRTFQLSGTSSA